MIPLRDANPTRSIPLVTIGLIVVCIAVFAFELTRQWTGGDRALGQLITTWGIVPAELVDALGSGRWLSPEVATLVTSQFLHAGWLHIGGNLLFLWIFGNNVEDRFGRLRFLLFYLVGGIVAGLAQVAIAPDSTTPTIGASGAIAATLGAYLVLYPGARVTSLVFLVFFYQLIDVPAVVVLALWFVLQLVDGLASLGGPVSGGGVAFFAHIGGFVFGAAVAALVRSRSGPRGPSRRPVG
jgi:rhomboid family protein